MKYASKTIERANAELERRRENAESVAEQRKQDFIKEHPEYAELELKLVQSGADAVKSILGCSDPVSYIENLKKLNLGYQQAKKKLLESAGLDENYLTPQYTCPKCKDTGYVNGTICDCYEELLKNYSCDELSKKTPLQLSSFDDFDVSLYKDSASRQKMSKVLEYCKKYAEDFDTDSASLFMYGETGLGKTHLSLAIAGVAIEKGFSVVYGSAHDFFTMIERERFGRSEEPDGTTEEKLKNCDLLILDDLGAEYITKLSIAELYSIINTRMAKELPTVISSNVALDELEKLYNNRITSRIIGTYQMLHFVGNDVRQV